MSITDREIIAIARVVADLFRIPEAVMFGGDRSACACRPRVVAMWIARVKFAATTPALGRVFNRHPATARQATLRAPMQWFRDETFKRRAEQAIALLACSDGPVAAEERMAARNLALALDAFRAVRRDRRAIAAGTIGASQVAITDALLGESDTERPTLAMQDALFRSAMAAAGYEERRA